MSTEVSLQLLPLLPVSMTLAGAQSSLSLDTPSDDAQLALGRVLRGNPVLGVAAQIQPNAGALSVDISSRKRIYPVLLTASSSLDFTGISAASEGDAFFLEVQQAAPGGFTIAWGATVKFSQDLPSLTLSTQAGATDVIGIDCRNGACRVIGFNRGF